MNSISPKFKITKKAAVVLLMVLLFPDTNTYKPQISLYGEKPAWSIGDLLESD
ncbi:MAG: hypothetical protein J6C76_00200 [Oscillospiraceae bacterium]|nr:hypothetical protein [Oscillospiraceae bacterium]